MSSTFPGRDRGRFGNGGRDQDGRGRSSPDRDEHVQRRDDDQPGTLQWAMTRSTGTLGSGAVVNNASLVFFRSGTATIGNAISGSGTVTQTMGTVILTGSNTYTGTTTIAVGLENVTLQVGNAGTSGTLGSGTVTSAVTTRATPNWFSTAAMASRRATRLPAG